MERFNRSTLSLLPFLVALTLTACGGSNESSSKSSKSGAPAGESQTGAQGPVAPQTTGHTATDGLNWFNYRRSQVGIPGLVRDERATIAAQGHSNYQRDNDVISHEQIPGARGFTGRTVGERLGAAGYLFTGFHAYGEVISATSDASGFNAAEDLIAAVYHRFLIFDPLFRQVGVGAATVRNGATYFTTNFVTERPDTGIGAGKLVTYPFAGQQQVSRDFFSDTEVPDPFPGRNRVGYPISVHADITSVVNVKEGGFTIRPRGGNLLAARVLTNERDSQTPASAAAIIPVEPLAPATTYDVQFSGNVDGRPVDRNWSFTTQ